VVYQRMCFMCITLQICMHACMVVIAEVVINTYIAVFGLTSPEKTDNWKRIWKTFSWIM